MSTTILGIKRQGENLEQRLRGVRRQTLLMRGDRSVAAIIAVNTPQIVITPNASNQGLPASDKDREVDRVLGGGLVPGSMVLLARPCVRPRSTVV